MQAASTYTHIFLMQREYFNLYNYPATKVILADHLQFSGI